MDEHDVAVETQWLCNGGQVVVRPHPTRLCVEHQDVGSRPEQLLEVFVLADLLDERRHLHRLQQQWHQPHLDEHTDIAVVTKVNAKRRKEDKIADVDIFLFWIYLTLVVFATLIIGWEWKKLEFFALAKFFQLRESIYIKYS